MLGLFVVPDAKIIAYSGELFHFAIDVITKRFGFYVLQ